jgi:hypothetical protein
MMSYDVSTHGSRRTSGASLIIRVKLSPVTTRMAQGWMFRSHKLVNEGSRCGEVIDDNVELGEAGRINGIKPASSRSRKTSRERQLSLDRLPSFEARTNGCSGRGTVAEIDHGC